MKPNPDESLKKQAIAGCQPGSSKPIDSGLGQLTLVEHALCPLDPRSGLVKNLVFNTKFVFTDGNRHAQTAEVNVFCPLGLCTGDELFLWGLLALTLAQPGAEGTLMATPHFVLRQLGLIDQHARRGGRQYSQFVAALQRLSVVKYQSDNFYDPIRGEHRRVSFGFLSYSLPVDDRSARSWRIVWDPVFFEFTKSLGGHLWFDLATYRELDPASRRLFLFLCKVFYRRRTTPRMPLRHLGQSVLGFSNSLVTRDLKAKVSRCVSRLEEQRVVAGTDAAITKQGRGEYFVTLERGRYFERPFAARSKTFHNDSPLCEPLRAIGFNEKEIARLLRKYSVQLLQEWSDITLAAREHRGAGFFTRSPQAYFMDNVKHAAKGGRTPPDWWHELRKSEQREPLKSGVERDILNRIRGEMSCHVPSGESVTETVRAAKTPARIVNRAKAVARRPERVSAILSVKK